MNISIKYITACAALLAMLSGCAVNDAYVRPDAPLPAQLNGALSENAAKPAAEWWQRFGSAELNDLMRQALAANHDLAAAVSRIRQARAASGVANANLYPTLDASAGATRTSSSRDSTTASGSSRSATISAAYEVDLWGGKASTRDAARAKVDYSVFDREAVALVLQADVASNYFQALALKERIVVTRSNLEAARQILALVELRFERGADTALEVSQQRTAVLTMEAQIPQLEQDLLTAQTSLAVLLGKIPQGFSVKGESLDGLAIPEVAGYQPPVLLERRPDIRKAEASLMAAHADIGVARAKLYPGLNLTASTVASGVFGGGSTVVSSLVASLTQSIFSGGSLQSQVEQSQAVRDELTEQYLQSILTGLKEVQDSYGLVSASTLRQAILVQAAQQAQETYRIANAKYRAGSSDMLTLLDSQRTKLQADDSRIQSDYARLSALVGLYKTLGGGWPALDQPPLSS
jgi:NodT family efflux transporter outer membrane factor (OMF) lipoprotein